MQRHRTAASLLVRTIALVAMAVLAFGCQRIAPDHASEEGGISLLRARTYAELLGEKSAAKVLQQTLDEEGSTDKKLTELALKTINVAASK